MVDPDRLPLVPALDASPSRLDDVPSLTYEAFYGLREKAFSLSADPRFWFRSASHGCAFDDLHTGIRRREGLIVLTGEIGTGKTTLCRSVLRQLDARTFAAFVPDPFVSREDLLKTLLVDFGVVSLGDLTRGRFNGASRTDLSYLLYEFLDSLVPLRAFAVLVIDEAQHLSLALLEEIRILSELERREKLLQVVLVGQPELRENLRLPQMRQVDHRVSVRCELTPLDAAGVTAYVQHRVQIAGRGTARVEFSAAALEAVCRGSAGVPRLINRICDRALQRGFATKSLYIEPDFVCQAVADLGLNQSFDEMPVVAISPTEPAPLANEPTVAPADAVAAAEIVDTAVDTASAQLVETASDEGDALLAFAQEDAQSAFSEPGPHSHVASDDAAVPSSPAPARLRWLAAALVVGLAAGYGLYVGAQATDDQLMVSIRPPSPKPAIGAAAVLPHADVEAPMSGAAVGLGHGAATENLGGLDQPATAAEPAPPPARTRSTLPGSLPDPMPDTDDSHFSILVASFRTRDRADQVVAALDDAGYRARAVERDWGPPRGHLVHVTVGGYASAEDVERDLRHIRQLPGGYRDARIVDRQE